jgi:hypothetical protein
MKKCFPYVVVGLLLAVSVQAHAGGLQTEQCPTADTIAERVDEISGVVYTAPAKNGLIWKGEHPRGEVGDAAKFRFAFRKDFDGARSPMCDYTVPGKPGAGARLTLHALRPL